MIKDLPTLLVWGMKDPGCVPLLSRWTETFTDYLLVSFDEVGHNVAEEAGNQFIAPLASFLAGREKI